MLDDGMRRLHARLEQTLRSIPAQLPEKPRAILVISGHWEEPVFTVMAALHPPMLYDYYGFPAHTYQIRYPVPGDPVLAQQVADRLRARGIPAQSDLHRGLDHGAIVPLMIMYPTAEIPVVQLSLRTDFEPLAHWEVGRALRDLRDEGVLILGSGLSYHNLRQFGPEAKAPAAAFDAWLRESVLLTEAAERRERLLRWHEAPAAQVAHPRPDHFLPLLPALGAAEDEPAVIVHHEDDFFGGIAVTSFRFGY